MTKSLPVLLVAASGALLSATGVRAQMPGEDTVAITKPVTYLQLPTVKRAPSGDIKYTQNLPSDIAAKVGRYSAEAYAPTKGSNVKTDRDVVQSVRTNGTQTICNQSVGSTTGATSPGGTTLNNQDQIVVLRGDMINICN